MTRNINSTIPIFIAGAAKSGTSSLFDILSMHPSISGVKGKEVHYFSREDRYVKGLTYYNSLFTISDAVKYTLDSSTSYLPSTKSHKRIYERYGNDVKIILLLRNPIERIASHFNYLRSLNIEKRSFADAISYDQRFEEGKHVRGTYANYLDFSKYGKGVESLFSTFEKKNILILPFAKLKSNRKELQKELETFLGLKFNEKSFEHRSNVTKKIVKHNSVLHKAYASIPLGIKKNAISRKVKEYYLSFKEEEKKYQLTHQDKELLKKLLEKDFMLQEKLFPTIFKSWNI